jgi:carbon starvation protein CstA
MAGLALLVVTLYLLMRDRPWYVAGIPMIAMLGTTLWAMASNLWGFTDEGTWLNRLLATDAQTWSVITEWASTGKLFLFGVGAVIFFLGVWTVVEAILAVRTFIRSDTTLEGLLIDLDD